MNAELLIAGIPATEWVGRRARFWGHENKQHPTPCLIMGLDNQKVIIKPIGHKKNEMVEADKIAPTWKNNDDLRQKYAAQLNGQMVEDPPDDDTTPEEPIPEAVSPLDEITVDEIDTLGEVGPMPELKRPKMTIHNHASDWMEQYQEYLELLKAEASDRALLREAVKSINLHRRLQAEVIVKLAALGVEIEDETARVDARPGDATGQLAPKQPRRRRGRIEMDKFVIDWGKRIKARLEAGEEVTGNVGYWSTELDISWKALGDRLTMLTKVIGVKFADDEGRTGDACRGTIKATLK